MSETYKINNVVLTFNHLIYVAVDGSDENGDGSQERPFASFEKAETIAVDGDAVVFGKGIFNLKPIYRDAYSAPFLWSYKEISIIGNGYETVLIANAEKYHLSSRDHPIFEFSIKDVYCLNVKYYPYGVLNYNCAVFCWTKAVLHNVAIENLSATTSMSVNYCNDGYGGSFDNCIIKSNGKNIEDYSGAVSKIINTLFDWDYKNSSVSTNKLVRTITNDDIEHGTAADLENVGVWAGEFAWKRNSKQLYVDKYNAAYGVC